MHASDWLSLTLICILGATSPGPSLAVVLVATRLRGRRGGCAAALGHGIGLFLYALMAAASVSYVLTHFSGLLQAVQIVGAFMLIWIGMRLIMAARCNTGDASREATVLDISRSFRDGFAIAVFNPKIAAFFASLFSLYLEAGQSTALHLAMATLAGVIDMLVYVMIVLLATLQRVKITFAKYAGTKYARMNDVVLGGVLLCFGIILFVQKTILN